MHYEFLGFDMRCCPEEYLKASWIQKKRLTYLLRPEIPWPLSVDTEVWPSAFDEFYESELPPNSQHPRVWAWLDLTTMKTFFATQTKVPNTHGITIAITLVTEGSRRDPEVFPDIPLLPSDIPSDWHFLGYDVADQDMLSGLTDYGYKEDTRAVLRATWTPRLNDYGLFYSLDDALQFREFSDQRVPGYAPFYVYAIYREPGGCDAGHVK